MEDQKAVRRGPWKLILIGDTQPMLFNLNSDLGEEHDIAEQHPKIVAGLLQSLSSWEADMDNGGR